MIFLALILLDLNGIADAYKSYVRYTGGQDEYAREHYDAASSGQAGGGGAAGNLTLFVCIVC